MAKPDSTNHMLTLMKGTDYSMDKDIDNPREAVEPNEDVKKLQLKPPAMGDVLSLCLSPEQKLAAKLG